MICVSIGRGRHKMMMAVHRHMAERGAQLCELRLDILQHPPDLGRLLADRPTPVIVTARRQQDKGLWKYSEEQRLTLLRSAIVAGVEYVDLEEDTAKQIRRYGKTKRIVSYHNFEETPHNLGEIHAGLGKCDPDIVKIVTMANTPGDNVRMLKLVQAAKGPTAGFCMGELGVVSRVLTGRYGSPLTYATVDQERTLAPGQLTFDDMRDLYQYDRINAETKLYGVIGDPIAQSHSPKLHNAAFAQAGLNSVYLPLRIPKELLKITLDQFDWFGFQGYSVTIPHKEAILDRTNWYEGPVREIGAGNTLYRDGDKRRIANTDYDAAMECLLDALKAANPEDELAASLSGKKVLVLGAGGAARALVFGLTQAGSAVTITNRSKPRGQELAEKFGCQYITWENRGAQFADILVNCTAVGMFPSLDETPFTENWLREGMLVFDTVYNPEHTLLIKQAKDRGCLTVTGIEMFVRQAAKQFRYFTGQDPDLDEFRKILRKSISAAKG